MGRFKIKAGKERSALTECGVGALFAEMIDEYVDSVNTAEYRLLSGFYKTGNFFPFQVYHQPQAYILISQFGRLRFPL